MRRTPFFCVKQMISRAGANGAKFKVFVDGPCAFRPRAIARELLGSDLESHSASSGSDSESATLVCSTNPVFDRICNESRNCVHFHVGVKVGQTIGRACPRTAKRLPASKLYEHRCDSLVLERSMLVRQAVLDTWHRLFARCLPTQAEPSFRRGFV
jgi:hypothetical protein